MQQFECHYFLSSFWAEVSFIISLDWENGFLRNVILDMGAESSQYLNLRFLKNITAGNNLYTSLMLDCQDTLLQLMRYQTPTKESVNKCWKMNVAQALVKFWTEVPLPESFLNPCYWLSVNSWSRWTPYLSKKYVHRITWTLMLILVLSKRMNSVINLYHRNLM